MRRLVHARSEPRSTERVPGALAQRRKATKQRVYARAAGRGRTGDNRSAAPLCEDRCACPSAPHRQRHDGIAVSRRVAVGDRRVGHAGRRRQGQGAQGRRPAGDRLRRGRAGLPHARLHRRAAAEAACRDPRYHRYTPAGGLPELREAIAAKTARDSGLRGLAGPGARDQRRQAGALRGVRRPCSTPATRCCCPRPTGRPTPSRSGSPAASRSRSPTDEATGYLATVEQLEAALTPRTKVLVFVSPSNPTGAVYPPDAGRGDRALGRRARPLGGHRRDLRAPRLRRRALRARCRRWCPSSPTAASSSTASPRPTR